jgi:hypothetical protein
MRNAKAPVTSAHAVVVGLIIAVALVCIGCQRDVPSSGSQVPSVEFCGRRIQTTSRQADCRDPELSDISPLAALIELETLTLIGNQVVSLRPKDQSRSLPGGMPST